MEMKSHSGKGGNRFSGPESAEGRRHFTNTQEGTCKISVVPESSSKLSILNFHLLYLLIFIDVHK